MNKFKSRNSKIVALLVFFLLLTLGISIYLYIQNHELSSTSVTKTLDSTKSLVDQVGKLVLLPNEEPTVATVTDPTKLRDQPFFANAQAGDKVLIYTTAHKAILYRPSANKIIEIAPLNTTATAISTGI